MITVFVKIYKLISTKEDIKYSKKHNKQQIKNNKQI